MLAESVAGELIKSEIEIRSGRARTSPTRSRSSAEAPRLFALAARHDAVLGATGTHPWSPWQEQEIIDTEHYHRVEDALQYVAWRNNTFSLHVHVGVNGAERAVRVRPAARGDARAARDLGQLAVPRRAPLRPHSAHADLHQELPALRDPGRVRGPAPTRLHRIPRPDELDHRVHAGVVERPPAPLVRDGGDADLRRADERDDSTALAALITSCIAQAALDHDEGVPFDDPPRRMIEENLWRAIRHGLDGKLIDLSAPRSTRRRPRWTACWRGPRRRGVLGIDPGLPDENGAQRQKRTGGRPLCKTSMPPRWR